VENRKTHVGNFTPCFALYPQGQLPGDGNCTYRIAPDVRFVTGNTLLANGWNTSKCMYFAGVASSHQSPFSSPFPFRRRFLLRIVFLPHRALCRIALLFCFSVVLHCSCWLLLLLLLLLLTAQKAGDEIKDAQWMQQNMAVLTSTMDYAGFATPRTCDATAFER